MISNIRYHHFANRVLRARRGFHSLLRIVLPVIIAIWWPVQALAAGFVIYALSGPVMSTFRRNADAPPRRS